MAEQDDLRHKLAQLQAHYLAELPQRLNDIEALWRQTSKNGKQAAEARLQLLRLLHNMAGSGTTFGLPRVTEIARELESSFSACLRDKAWKPTADSVAIFERALQQLREAAQQPLAAGANIMPPTTKASGAHSGEFRERHLIYMVDDDRELGEALAMQIHYFGFDVHSFIDPSDLMRAIKSKPPSAIIMDMEFPDGEYAGAKAIQALQVGRSEPIPVVYLTAHDEFEARLEAVRAGCDGYFTKPVDVGELIDRLDALLSWEEQEPYRVMIVDDTLSVAQFHALTLRQAGMQTLAVTDPAMVLQALDDFSPDTILMDMYMPVCNGDELAQIIRQQPAFVSIPIVFLSAERDVKKQLTAMHHGGDDFLTKPIDPLHLVASVTIRSKRYRTLRSLMIKDGLTGLLNHSRIEEELQIEVSRAEREGAPLAFVMVDLDHFKSVNDSYGHQVGDRVLKSLARLLKERMRRTDRIGRYGGEEFTVVLPNTDSAMAVKVMDNVREAFSKIKHRAEQGEFSVTMSCGIAIYKQGETHLDLSKVADDALYEAKRGGRNKVVLAQQGKAA